MDSQLLDKVKNLNRISLIFGILSVAMPILLISLPILMRIFQIQGIQFEVITLFTRITDFMKTGGILFGLIGYFISRQVLNLIKYEKASDELISKTQASRTWNIIGIVIFLAIFCGSLNRGIAF